MTQLNSSWTFFCTFFVLLFFFFLFSHLIFFSHVTLYYVIWHKVINLYLHHWGFTHCIKHTLAYFHSPTMALKKLSYNVKGLNSIKKRWLALKGFRASGADVILIQETHFCAGGSFKFASKYFPVSYMATDSSGKAGVAVLISCSCPLQIKFTHLDPHGRYIILQSVFMSSPIMLMNVYAPNSGRIKFLTEAFELLQRFSKPFKVVGRNFNIAFSPTQDRRSLFQTMLPLPIQSLDTFFYKLTRAHHLFDKWRIKHPTSSQFSFYSPPHKMFSRLDYFFMTAPLLPNTVSSDLGTMTWSDHAPLTLDLSLATAFPKKWHRRLCSTTQRPEINFCLL